MRTIVKTIEVYELNELKGVNYRNAVESVSRQASEFWTEFESFELLESMKKSAEHFGMQVTNYSIGLFDRSYVKVETGCFDEEQAEYAVKWIADNYEAGADGTCPFTGVYFDSYFFDYFVKNGVPTEDNVKDEIVRAIGYMLETAVDNAENDMMDDGYMLDYASNNELSFLSDGAIFHG